MSGERQTVAGAYLKIAAHEELCAERYRGINEKLSWVLRSLVGMVLALLAWALVQLYALEPLRLERPDQLPGRHSATSQNLTSAKEDQPNCRQCAGRLLNFEALEFARMRDSDTLLKAPTVLDRADRARVVLEPFPHIVIENALPDDVFKALSSSFPTLADLPADLAGANNKRFNLYASWGPTELPKERTPKPWQAFLEAHTSVEFSRKVFALFPEATVEGASPGERWIKSESFGEGLADKLGLSKPVSVDDVIARATVAVNTPVSSPTSVRGPHVDSIWKAYVGLYYVRSDGDDSLGGDLSLYRWKAGAKVDPWTKKADPSLVEEFFTVRYSPNTYVLMLNTHDSLHGVTTRQATGHIRRFAVTSGWFPGVDESSLLGRRRGILERVKAFVRPIIAPPTVAEYQD